MKEKRREERLILEPPDIISAEFEIGKGSEKGQLWHLDAFDCSRHGLGLLVTEFDSALLQILNPGDRIKGMALYTEWAISKVDATVRHITKIKRGSHEGQYVLGVESEELEELNEGVKANIREFAKKLSSYYNIPEETAEWLLDSVGMSRGDAYMTAKVSKVANRPVEDVVEEYKANRGKGWGVIVKKLGIKPGSKEFHELKKDDSGMLRVAKGKKKKEKQG